MLIEKIEFLTSSKKHTHCINVNVISYSISNLPDVFEEKIFNIFYVIQMLKRLGIFRKVYLSRKLSNYVYATLYEIHRKLNISEKNVLFGYHKERVL